jgi:membrane-associated phospholipid phosphatase
MAMAQQKDTLTKKLDSLTQNKDSTGAKQKNNIAPANYNENTKITAHVYLVLVADDIKQQITAPFRATGSDWLKIGAFATVTAGVVLFADRPINRLAVDIGKRNPGVVTTSTYVTNFGGLYEAYTLAALGTYGLVFKKEKEKTTTLLATQAYITAATIELSLKYLVGRQRPYYYDPVTSKNALTFHGPFYAFQHGAAPATSFPSGHTTVAFAAATVFAMEYRSTRIVPVIAYSAATLIGLSRITENAHWASDVLVGAALGFLCGRQVVNNYHRYSKIQSASLKNKGSFRLNLNYSDGILEPGFIYTFRKRGLQLYSAAVMEDHNI